MRYIFGIALAFGLAFAAYGAAATLNVNGGTIQSGQDFLLTCTDSANVLGWGFESDDDLVYSVRIAVDEACEGNTLFAMIKAGDATLFTAEQTVITDECDGEPDGQVCVSLGGADGFSPVPAVNITSIHITIEGAAGSPNDPVPGP